jgi:hypothetical protein
MAMLTQMRVRSRYDYDPVSGDLTYRVTVSGNAKAGMRAGCNHYQDAAHTIPNRRVVSIDGTTYAETQIIWLWQIAGLFPDNIDVHHRYVNLFNNAWGNLRLATGSDNSANQRKIKAINGVATTSTLKGVTRQRGCSTNPWLAQVYHPGRRYYLGLYPSEQAAHNAYMAAARQLQGQFAQAA